MREASGYDGPIAHGRGAGRRGPRQHAGSGEGPRGSGLERRHGAWRKGSGRHGRVVRDRSEATASVSGDRPPTKRPTSSRSTATRPPPRSASALADLAGGSVRSRGRSRRRRPAPEGRARARRHRGGPGARRTRRRGGDRCRSRLSCCPADWLGVLTRGQRRGSPPPEGAGPAPGRGLRPGLGDRARRPAAADAAASLGIARAAPSAGPWSAHGRTWLAVDGLEASLADAARKRPSGPSSRRSPRPPATPPAQPPAADAAAGAAARPPRIRLRFAGSRARGNLLGVAISKLDNVTLRY